MAVARKKASILGKTVNMILVYFKMPNYEILRDWFPLYANIWEVQNKLAANINVVPGNILLRFKGEKLNSWTPLAGLDYEKHFLIVFEVELLKDNFQEPPKQQPSVHVRMVKVLNNEEEWLDMTVVVEVENNMKEWLGGKRNKVTGVEYHHAWCQTTQLSGRCHKDGELPSKRVENYSQTPTCYMRTQATMTRHDHGTQMPKPGLYNATYGDRIVEPGTYKPYVSDEPFFPRVVNLNKFKRKWLELLSVKKKKKQEIAKKAMEELRIKINKKYSESADWNFTISTVYPTDRHGFENLYSLVNSWYDKERKKLLDAFILPSDGGFKAFLLEVFNKKLVFFRQIDVLKTRHREESLQKQRMKLFDEASKPKISYYKKGNITVIDTLDTQRSRVLKEVYSSYIRQDYEPEERIEMLLELKNFLETAISLDLYVPLNELINREIDMIAMGIKHLKGLRLRITDLLFFSFTSEKPNLEDYQKEEGKVVEPTNLCISCNELKPKKAFSGKSQHEKRYCDSCLWLRRRNTGSSSLAPFKFMLDKMRKSEEHDKHSIIKLIQPTDIATLVKKIWHGCSALSGCRDPYMLWLAAWDKRQKWFPWNCILLTKEEAAYHKRIRDLEACYNPDFIARVNRMNLEAKFEFKSLYHSYMKSLDQSKSGILEKRENKIKKLLKKEDPFFEPAIINVRRREQ